MTQQILSDTPQDQQAEPCAPRGRNSPALHEAADLPSRSNHAAATAPVGDVALAVPSPEDAQTQHKGAVSDAASHCPRGRRISLAGAIWAEALADQYRLIDSGRGADAARRALGCDFTPERAAAWLTTVARFRGQPLTRTA